LEIALGSLGLGLGLIVWEGLGVWGIFSGGEARNEWTFVLNDLDGSPDFVEFFL